MLNRFPCKTRKVKRLLAQAPPVQPGELRGPTEESHATLRRPEEYHKRHNDVKIDYEAAGIETAPEEATSCCFADWAVDHDGHNWEVLVVLDADARDESYARSGCCGPDPVLLNVCIGSTDANKYKKLVNGRMVL